MAASRTRALNRRSFTVAATLLVAVVGHAFAQTEDVANGQQTTQSQKIVPASVQELPFGDALFYFYQDDYFNAITRMLAANKRQQLAFHAEEAQLLLGGMYLSYGQHRAAGEVFETLLASKELSVRNRAWFFLARIKFQRGYFDQANVALAGIDGELDEKLEPTRKQLEVQLLMAQRRFADAVKVLNAYEYDGDWAAFAAFNLGIALLRDGRFDESEEFLKKIGTQRARSLEMRGLKDKANLALAFSYLQRERSGEARSALNRVYLDGPFASKALLGAAWADIEQKNFQQALVPLRALGSRSTRDAAVQEALLAQPYALANLSAPRQAAEAYERAISAFNQESSRLSQSMTAIHEGTLIKALMDGENPRAMGWFWNLSDVSNAPENLYLYELMADHAFQENLKNYRDLIFLRGNLARWSENITAFDDMLALGRAAHATRLPEASTQFAVMNPDALHARSEALTQRLQKIREQGDALALATAAERATLNKLDALQAQLVLLDDEHKRKSQQERLRLMRGVVHWELQQQWSQRLWALEKSLKSTRAGVDVALGQTGRLNEALVAAPNRFAGFEARIDTGHARLLDLHAQLEPVISAQAQQLNDSAVTVLAARKEVLDAYTVQARFALAAIYDKAGTLEGAP